MLFTFFCTLIGSFFAFMNTKRTTMCIHGLFLFIVLVIICTRSIFSFICFTISFTRFLDTFLFYIGHWCNSRLNRFVDFFLLTTPDLILLLHNITCLLSNNFSIGSPLPMFPVWPPYGPESRRVSKPLP